MKINKTSPVKPPIVNLYKSRVCLEKAQVTAKKKKERRKGCDEANTLTYLNASAAVGLTHMLWESLEL